MNALENQSTKGPEIIWEFSGVVLLPVLFQFLPPKESFASYRLLSQPSIQRERERESHSHSFSP